MNINFIAHSSELKVKDQLLDTNGNILLIEKIEVELTDKPTTVYNFQMEDFHTYYVGENCVWVHNASDLYKRGGFRKSTHEKALREAPRNESGEMICPTCGKVI